ncbi:hypothetical protein KRR38_30525 [Novosphingobium sp. G106]|uniref:hypothetical protein n=1 Tax=Novosphingobium sp. G106 TaxID=2849500 RepID=UPI001C2CD555|nr:hypothetical protein [Novosphingobium sp. G106]MBV1691885.1 hypothetical protein [Novosphingobium sp. G106]
MVSMKSVAVPILAALMMPACVSNSPVSVEDRTLRYGCNDLVVVGRIIENGAYEPVQDDDDLIGHAWVSARIKVKKVLKGADIPAVLPVRYFAHVHMREDRDFMFVIRSAEKGYEIETGQLMSVHPRLAARCD